LKSGDGIAWLQPARKRFDNLSGNIAEKLPPPRQNVRLDIYRLSRNNVSQFPPPRRKVPSHAQPTVG
jgi:hypothetical protein